ncbi:hypothetical protein [Leptospira andrefontaineae]|uniref:hypothetical protein n=1 Tax=Leptospira andrefontaineae TaxID=2484976 RepID=UPI0010916E58|nr:hypothetical protein [Leptospira andrefontaineae]
MKTEQLSFPELIDPEPNAFPIPYCPVIKVASLLVKRLKDKTATFGSIHSIIILTGECRIEFFHEGNSASVSVPAYGGKVSDKGTIFIFESSFRYCRFSLDIGMIRQDITRSYSIYVGDTTGTVSSNEYLLRFPNIDLGQMSHHSKQILTEVYIMPGASFFYDSDGIY